MERIELTGSNELISWRHINKIIQSLPQTGKGLKCLILDGRQFCELTSTHWIDFIVKNCLNHEELNNGVGLPANHITLLCENLPLNIMKLELNLNFLHDGHLKKLVKRCTGTSDSL